MGSFEPVAPALRLAAALQLDVLENACSAYADSNQDAEGTHRFLEHYSSLLVEAGRAAIDGDLSGLVQVIEWLRANVDLSRRTLSTLAEDRLALLSSWPACAQAYLMEPDEQNIEILLGHIQYSGWSLRPFAGTLASLRASLSTYRPQAAPQEMPPASEDDLVLAYAQANDGQTLSEYAQESEPVYAQAELPGDTGLPEAIHEDALPAIDQEFVTSEKTVPVAFAGMRATDAQSGPTAVADLPEHLLEPVHSLHGALERFLDIAALGVRRDVDRQQYRQALQTVTDFAQNEERVDLLDICARVEENLAALDDLPSAATAAALPLLDLPILLSGYFSAPQDTDSALSLLECLGDSGWPRPLGADERPLLASLLGLDETPMSEEHAATTEAALDAPANLVRPELDVQLQRCDPEQLSLLDTEFTAFTQTLDTELESADPAEPENLRRRVIESCAELLRRFAGAADAVGLPALHWTFTTVATQVDTLSSTGIAPELRAGLRDWSLQLRGYLATPTDRAAALALARSMSSACWPSPLSDVEASTLQSALVELDLVQAQAAAPRAAQATPEDVALDVPEDAGEELIESLLAELPVQSAEFAAAIQRVASGSGTLYDVEAAKRAAHTLKGAANTVGVKGIASLTHHVEDILVALTRYSLMPNDALANLLSSASDCLEGMSEALLGVSPEPTDALDVLQQILDWANRIDSEGADALVAENRAGGATGVQAGAHEDDGQAASRSEVRDVTHWETPDERPEVSAAAAVAVLEPTANAGHSLRLSTTIVDELLRLVGETMIANTQIKEQLRQAMDHTRSVTRQSHALQQLANDLETLVDVRGLSLPARNLTPSGDFDALEFDRYNELHTLSRRLVEAATDSKELSVAGEERLLNLADLLETQSRLQLDNQNVVMRTRMVSVGSVVSRLQRSVRQTGRLLDKPVELLVRGSDTTMDSNILGEIVDPLMHALRNAVDHGIESPERRAAAGKPPTGRIELGFAREGSSIVIQCRDDGAGLDLQAIRARALARGLIEAHALLDEDELARLILIPGFSTRDETSQISGRGIGMDVINQRVIGLKGSLRLNSVAGQGLTLEIRLPVSLTTLHGLLVRVGRNTMAISTYGIQDIHYVTCEQLRNVNAGTVYVSDGQARPLERLESLLQLPPPAEEPAWFPTLLVGTERGVRAVAVEEVSDSQEIVLKDLGTYVDKPAGVLGVTVLGDGSIAPVLDLPQLLRAAHAGPRSVSVQTPRLLTPVPESSPLDGHRTALVVDDSLTARRAAAQLMRDAGFEVRTAVDGMEAAAMIEKKVPDIVITDMEMPRLNGLELTLHLRSRAASRETPVIMITSRSTEKHRQEAAKAGVDVYVTKPFNDEELLRQVERLTAGALVR